MRRAFRAAFRRAENEDTGEEGNKRQEGIPAGRVYPQETARSLEILLMRREIEHMFHVKHSQKGAYTAFFAKYSQFFFKRISFFAY